MKRAEIVMVAKMLGVKAVGKNEDILAEIQKVLDLWKKEENPSSRVELPPIPKGVTLGNKAPQKDPRLKGFHPITGEPIYK